jgi:hypothetical protein
MNKNPDPPKKTMTQTRYQPFPEPNPTKHPQKAKSHVHTYYKPSIIDPISFDSVPDPTRWHSQPPSPLVCSHGTTIHST